MSDMIITPRLSRRHLLGGAAAAAAALSAAPALAKPRLFPGWRPVHRNGEPDWDALARSLSGPVLRPSDPDFRLIARPNNMRYVDTLPQGIARCRSTADVSAALRWARRYNVALTARSGGHSYAGYSSTKGLMLDTTLMNGISYQPETGMARIQGGLRNYDVTSALRAQGRAITHGRCPSVGSSAFLLGGGIGFNMRGNGLGCDFVQASEIVLADGSVRTLTDQGVDIDKELRWATRGCAGGNLGISTRFDLRTFSVRDVNATVFNLAWTVRSREVAEVLMAVLDQAPNSFGSRLSLSAVSPCQKAAGGDVVVSLLGQFRGASSAALRQLLAPIYKVAAPAKEDIRELTYWEAQDFLHEDGWPTWYQERSSFVTRPMTSYTFDLAFEWLRRWPGTNNYCDLKFFQTGGAINQVGARDTAFWHRSSRWLMVVGLYWSEQDNHDQALMDKNHAWQDGFYADMAPRVGEGGAYQNFPDPSLGDFRSAYYGGNLGRLVALRERVDPDRLFNFPQAI